MNYKIQFEFRFITSFKFINNNDDKLISINKTKRNK